MSLGSLAARGAIVTLGIQVARFAVQLIGLVILGRILTPSDFGLVAMVTVVIGIADIVREFGLIPAAIQAPRLTRQQRSNLFWICSASGVVLAVFCSVISPLIASFYGEPRLVAITLCLSTMLIFNGVQAQFQADLARKLRFASLSTTDLASQVIGLGVGVASALLGLGYWAIVIQFVGQSLSLLTLRVAIADWSPGVPRRGVSVRSFVGYGRSLVATQTLVHLSSNVDSALVGARFGASELGIYNRGFQMLTLPLSQILNPLTAVALPILSKLSDDHDRFNSYIQRAQIVVAYPVVLLFSCIWSCSHALVRIVFGEQWEDSADIFSVLTIAGIFQAIGYVGYWAFLAKGLTKSHLRYSLISRTLLVLSIFVGSNWGILGIAVGYSVGTALNWPFVLVWLRRVSSIEIRPLFFGGVRSILLGLLCVAAVQVLTNYAPSGDIPSIGLAVLMTFVVSVTIFAAVPIYRKDARAFLETSNLAFGRRASGVEKVG